MGEPNPPTDQATAVDRPTLADEPASVERPQVAVAPTPVVESRDDLDASGPIESAAATGLLSRDAWARAFALEERRLARYRRPCSVVAVGLDGLEALSLRIGADGAERLVRPLIETLTTRARAADLVCRIDRTRFVALLPETDEAGASAYAARLARATGLWLAAAPVAVGLAIGWGSPAPGGTLASALVTAERRMDADRVRRDQAPASQASFQRSTTLVSCSQPRTETVAT